MTLELRAEQARQRLQAAVERVIDRADALATCELSEPAERLPRQVETVRALTRAIAMAALSVEREAGAASELAQAVASAEVDRNG